jgi:hypothetical protein
LACYADAVDDHSPTALRARLNAAHLLEAEVRTPKKCLHPAARYLERAGAAVDALEMQGDS